jgi:hypothetical protein
MRCSMNSFSFSSSTICFTISVEPAGRPGAEPMLSAHPDLTLRPRLPPTTVLDYVGTPTESLEVALRSLVSPHHFTWNGAA